MELMRITDQNLMMHEAGVRTHHYKHHYYERNPLLTCQEYNPLLHIFTLLLLCYYVMSRRMTTIQLLHSTTALIISFSDYVTSN